METDRQLIRRIAHLSRLELEENEAETMAGEFAGILAMVGRLAEVDVDGVEPFINAAGGGNVMRADATAPSLPRAEGLANAPEQAGGFFKVPEVI